LRANAEPTTRLARWLNAMKSGLLAALRRLEEIEAWAAIAEREMAPLSGKTPPTARPLHKLAAGFGADGGAFDRRASSDGSAKHRRDGGEGLDPGGCRAGAIPDAADRRDTRDQGHVDP
jgi:hypothetical protein